MKGLLRYIVALTAMLLVLSGCSGGGSCAGCSNGSSPSPTSLTLALTAPNQYPAGESVTAYLTITNTSSESATNLTYTIPKSTNYTYNPNYPNESITTNAGLPGQICTNLAAGESCTFAAYIPASALAGSFTVIATTSSAQVGSLWVKAKSLVGIKSTIQLSLTANIGLVNLPPNTEESANGITFLYAHTVSENANGPTQVIIVAVVNSAAAGTFNSIVLTDANGDPLTIASQLSESTPGGLFQGNVVTFLMNIPNGVTSPYIFYGQTQQNGNLVSQGTIPNPINLVANGLGVLAIQPNLFNLSPTHESQIITYTNTGTGPITNLMLTPSSNLTAASNTTAKPCTPGMTLAPVTPTTSGGSCTYVVQYNPAQPATGSGNVAASYSNGQANESGYAYVTLPGLSISSGTNPSLTFTSNVGAPVESSIITLTNTGDSAESNVAFTLPTYFTLAAAANNSCTLSGNSVTDNLAPSASCNLMLVYTNSTLTPVSNANLSASFTYGSNQGQNGTSIVVVTYSTIPAPTAKPFVSLVFNTPAASGGNGSIASPFQIEQSNTPSMITLVYSNNGNADATGFTVSENTLPNGYTAESNTCNGIDLPANQGDTCYIQLQVALDTPESQNFSLESSVLSASWSDYQSYTNQALNWVNTAAATTQNQIYLNVYQQPVVNLSLSADADGSSVVSTVVQNGTYYLVYRLSGGYNVESAIYSTTLPAGMTFAGSQQTCTVSSSVTTCIIQVNAGSNLGNFPLNVSGGSGSVPTATVPNPLSIQVVKLTYAYILNDDYPNNYVNPTVSQCLVSAVDGSLSGCVSFGDNDAFANAPMASPASPSAMAIGESTLFITNYYDDNTVTTFSPIISCPLSESNGSLNNCTYLTSASMGLTDTDMIEPDGIAIESGIAYISAYNDPNQDFGVMYTCNVNGSALTNCVMSSTMDPNGVAQYIYDGVDGNSTTSDIAVNGTNSFFNPSFGPGVWYLGYCDLFGLNCNVPNTTGLTQFTDGIDGITLYANGLIVPGDNYDFENPQPGSYSSIVFCDLGLINCNSTGSFQANESYISAPAVYNKFIYLPLTNIPEQSSSAIEFCPITNDGTNTTISSTCVKTGDAINSILSDPLYIVFGHGSLPPVAPPTPPVVPTVTATSPTNSATGVYTTTTITVVFNESMNTSTLIPSNFVLSDTSNPSVATLGSPVYTSGNTTVTFTLATPLNGGDNYTLTIPTPANILSQSGAALKVFTPVSFTVSNSSVSCSSSAYVLDSATNSLTTCDVNADGSLTNCGVAAVSSFNNPQSFYYDGDYGIYAINKGNSTLSWYNVIGSPSSTATTGSNFNSPTGISAIPTPPLNLGVIINGNGSMTACRVADGGFSATLGQYTNCVESTPTGYSPAAYGVAVIGTTNNGVVYTTNKSTNTVSVCPIFFIGGADSVYTVGSPCIDSGAAAGSFSGPSGISANPSTVSYVLVTNSANNTVEKCTADSGTGVLSNCAPTATDATVPVFNQPNYIYEDIAGGDDLAYITNAGNNTVTVCADNNGTLSGCQVMGSSTFQAPTAVYSTLQCGGG